MATDKKSSKRPYSRPSQDVRKRQRVDKQLAAPKPRGKVVSGGTVAIDDLAWREVALPDTLEDAEGFFGLEEIDDVQIVREGDKVQYWVHAADKVTGTDDGNLEDTKDNPFSETEWEGFEEDDQSEVKPRTILKPTNHRVEPKTKNKSKPDKKSKTTSAGKPDTKSVSTANGFAALQESDTEGVDVSAWLPLGLSSFVLAALEKLKFSTPTPIQIAAIPDILSGEDMIGKASTGSGKTLAFGLPILESVLKARKEVNDVSKVDKIPTALILSPTRELAHQISQHIIDVCSNLTVESPRVATITGGLSIQKQERLLAKADIVIGTPGRLWEVMSTIPGGMKRLKQIKFLVADEADRLLSDGHFKEVEEILNALDKKEIDGEASDDEEIAPPKRQTLVFSATFQKDLQRKLVGRIKTSNNILDNKESLDYLMQKLNFRSEPKFIDVNPVKQMAANLREGLLECGAMEKDLYLYALLLQYPKMRTLVFTNSISSVRRLVPLLQNLNLKPFGLHSEMPQKARLRSVEKFSDAASVGSILVATDVAARGLDIPAVDLVIHYHVPRAADTYVHRSGRTARGSLSGMSVMLCAPEEIIPVQRLVAKVHASSAQDAKKPSLRTLSLDRNLVVKIKPRITLAASIVSATSSKSKTASEESWLRKAAEDLGVDYDSEDFAEEEASAKGRGRGKGRKQATRDEATGTSKEQLASWRAELKSLLSKRVNVGVSEKYLTAGGVDVDALLAEQHSAAGRVGGEFLGNVDGIRGWD